MLISLAYVDSRRRQTPRTEVNMRLLFLIAIATLALPLYAQSRRVAPMATPAPTIALDLSVKQMFDEANSYNKLKFAEFEQKKIAYTERLRLDTERQQRQL